MYYNGEVKNIWFESYDAFVRFSGRAPGTMSLNALAQQGFNEINPVPTQHGHAVTVPGAAAAWDDVVSTFGSGKVKSHLIWNNRSETIIWDPLLNIIGIRGFAIRENGIWCIIPRRADYF